MMMIQHLVEEVSNVFFQIQQEEKGSAEFLSWFQEEAKPVV